MKAKRIIASALGVSGLLASVFTAIWAIALIQDLRSPGVSLWFALVGVILMFLMAVGEVGIGVWFFLFARREHDVRASWVRNVLVGIGCFFPGFLLSLPLTVVWSRYTYPGDGQAVLAAIPFSLEIGTAATVVGCAALLKRAEQPQDTDK